MYHAGLPLESDKQELRIKGARFILECLISAFLRDREKTFLQK